jgi:hypothetical protein
MHFCVLSEPALIAILVLAPLQGMEVQVMDLSLDSEDEASARLPDRKHSRPSPGPCPDHRGGYWGIEGHDTYNIPEQGSAVASL